MPTEPGAQELEAGSEKPEVTVTTKEKQVVVPAEKESEPDEDSNPEELSPEDAKKLIKKLRGENAKTRLKGKELEKQLGGAKKALIEAGVIPDDSVDPEEKVKSLSAQAGSLQVENAILSMCLEHGVGKGEAKYFRFLVNDALDELPEGEELSDERIEELADEARARGVKNPKSTSVGGKGKGQGAAAPDQPADGVTYEAFIRMPVLEQSAFFGKNPDLAKQYMHEARVKGQLVGKK